MRHSAFKLVGRESNKLGSKDSQLIEAGIKQQKSRKATSWTSLAIASRIEDQWSQSEHPVGE